MKAWAYLSLFTLFVGPLCARADADGGQIRASRRHGDYLVTVFTSPTPLRAGPIDVSVLIQDANSDSALTEAPVTISLTPSDPSGAPIRAAATNAAATNKLLQAAVVDLPAAGVWQVDVECTLPHDGRCDIAFTMDAAPPLPAWLSVWPWFSWPAVVVLLFAVHRWRIVRRQRAIGRNDRDAARKSNHTPSRLPSIATA